ncbi:hypothetical protein MASSI9I_50283 [Massilia sp. 9I]|nr:hypothetical protein MASSI9I_50283 [Massilia sp. 9I]
MGASRGKQGRGTEKMSPGMVRGT